MGQYFNPILLTENNKVKAWAYSHEYNNGLKLMEHSWIGNNFVNVIETLIKENPTKLEWAGDYAKPERGSKKNLYDRCIDELKVTPIVKMLPKSFKYIVNHDKKEYVDKTEVPGSHKDWNKGWNKGWQIHPLPLLTCNGNGQGGGDFYGNDPDGLVGSWARDHISVEKKIPVGYKKLDFNLVEN